MGRQTALGLVLPRESLGKNAMMAEAAEDEFTDVLDAEPAATETFAKPKGFDDLDLPDLELPATPVADSTDQPDTPHE